MSLSSSTMPLNAASSPIGSCSGATPAPKRSFSWSSVRENDARSRSSLLTKIARGMPRCFGELPRDLGLHLDALDRGHDEQREVGGLERGADVADEVGVARRVEEVDLGAVELERRQRERHRDPAALLLGVEVADRRAVLDLAEAGDRPGREQEGLGERGLAGAAVADEGDVADVGRRERLHPMTPGFASCGRAIVRTHRPPPPVGQAHDPAGRSERTWRRDAGAVAVVPWSSARGREHSRRVRARALAADPRRSSRMLDRRWRHGVERGLGPLGRGLRRIGVPADALTVFGLLALGRHRGPDRVGPPRLGGRRRDRRRRERPARRRDRPRERPGQPARRVLRLRHRPRLRRAAARRRRLVPRGPLAVRADPRVRGRRVLDARLLRAGPRRSRSGSTPAAG